MSDNNEDQQVHPPAYNCEKIGLSHRSVGLATLPVDVKKLKKIEISDCHGRYEVNLFYQNTKGEHLQVTLYHACYYAEATKAFLIIGKQMSGEYEDDRTKRELMHLAKHPNMSDDEDDESEEDEDDFDLSAKKTIGLATLPSECAKFLKIELCSKMSTDDVAVVLSYEDDNGQEAKVDLYSGRSYAEAAKAFDIINLQMTEKFDDDQTLLELTKLAETFRKKRLGFGIVEYPLHENACITVASGGSVMLFNGYHPSSCRDRIICLYEAKSYVEGVQAFEVINRQLKNQLSEEEASTQLMAIVKAHQ